MSTTKVDPRRLESQSDFSFNLWTEPWIGALRSDGSATRLGIRDCLMQAHELRVFTDPSPMVVASLQRLLAAIVQDVFRPRAVADITTVLKQKRFENAAIDRFGDEYRHRFDLFSPTEPILQTADIGLTPEKGDRTKTVGYLFPEEPTATNINHFFHQYDSDYQYSPATSALGLIAIAPFASSGGAGIRPSINGVPPLYVLPYGDTIFATLALSLVTPGYQPEIADSSDKPAWRREPIVKRNHGVLGVGYLESLTFPARRVRLFPERVSGYDSRTGEQSDILVRRMVFDMGHSRPKDAELWRDPFAAYRARDKGPVPVRPQEGKSLWREYGNLFHVGIGGSTDAASGKIIAPQIVEQLANLPASVRPREDAWRFRCIGLRTDMKAKVFEWVDETLDVPPGILADSDGQQEVQGAIERVETWARTLGAIYREVFGEGRDQHDADRRRMMTEYWLRLASPFHVFVSRASNPANRRDALTEWIDGFFDVGYQVLTATTDQAGTRGEAMEKQALALTKYRMARARMRKEWVG